MDAERSGEAAEPQDEEMITLPRRTVLGMLTLMWTFQSAAPTDNPELFMMTIPKNHLLLAGELISEVPGSGGADFSFGNYIPPQGD